MKIKAKLILGVGLLFLMIVLLTAMSTIFINRLSADTQNILVANYNTLNYSREMHIALDDGIGDPKNLNLFESNLKLQQKNITEVGERELTDNLARNFSGLKQTGSDSFLIRAVRKDISNIMLLNMQAIQRKSEIAGKTALNSIFWVDLTGTLCFLIAFTLLVNLPSNIANPIKELTASIKQIAAQNYSQRVHFEKDNEFGMLAASFNTMAEKLEEYKASDVDKLMMEKKRIETLINNMSDPVIGLDSNQTILFANNTALKITGMPEELIVGKNIREVALQNDLVKSLAENLAAETGAIKSLPVKIYADNKESYFEKEIIPIRIVPTGEEEEVHIGDVILLQNITPYKELDFAKTNFIATVSHELKTPIAAIKMSLQLLENKQVGALNEEQRGLVESIKEDAGRLLKITGELLNMTQVDSGTIQINVMPANVEEIVAYAVSATRAAAEQKQVQVAIKIADNLPQVLADKEKTAWVLTNLLSNAIRYSYDNSRISIGVTAGDNKIRFAVTDTGQGIPPQYVDKVFERYFRIPGTKKEGTGLGLSISKEFIEVQGGQIAVKSDFGAGSTFSFVLNSLQTNRDDAA
ncbi:ATP-binding protein [Niabella soli]|uniref:histidine kinase n=1 Tax=Niabella soli DSM 19437 TaxID=929713 RepID=W0EX93_9BACT|nr:ATP-binding protein [Niabella soli]AHF15450.1 histidine kinase [Niabella soli DSM 19437]